MSLFDGLGGLVTPDLPVGRLTTYKLGGPARFFAEVTGRSELERVLAAWRETDLPLLVLGRGSNLVVHDRGLDALVMRLAGAFTQVVMEPDAVRAGAAVGLPQLARSAVAAGRLGLEFFVGIPGSVGGAVRQNAGGHGSETRDVLIDAVVLDARTGATATRSTLDLDLSYRHSNLRTCDVVLEARFAFRSGDPQDGDAEMRAVTRWRRDHQPGGTFNAGSVFKNPPGDSAGRIIDSLGLKGMRVGGVRVSEKHANFFVAAPDATAVDLHTLVTRVAEIVRERTGVRLEREIQFEGFD